ncbi:MAG: hypothetical protein JNK49_11740 [Planctomycetes bacterium]|nr:hypothetical protein [Planctomycetota bacterium]
MAQWQRWLGLVLFAAFAVGLGIGWGGAEPPPDALPLPVPVAPGPVSDPPAVPVLPAGAPRVEVVVHERFAYLPPPPARVVGVAADGRTELPLEVLGGLGSDPFAKVAPAHGVALVAIDAGAEHRVLRVVAIDGPEPARVPLGGRALVRGVVHGPEGPLADALVGLGEIDDAGELRCASTDAEGRFELDAPTGPGVPLVVRKQGFAAHGEVVDLMPRDDREREIRLGLAGTVVAQLASAAHDVALARLYAVPPAGGVASELLAYPWFLQTLRGGIAFDASGRAVLDDLPLGAAVGLVVVHPGTPIPTPTVAVPQVRHRPVLLSVALGAVVPRAVQHAPDAAVLLAQVPTADRNGRASGRFLPAFLDAPGTILGWGDGAGQLLLPAALPARGLLRLWASGHAGRELDLANLRAADFALPVWQGGGEPALVLSPPLPGLAWGSVWQLGAGFELQHAADTTATVALPRAGRYAVTLTTVWGGQRVAADLLEVDATGPVALAAPRPE